MGIGLSFEECQAQAAEKGRAVDVAILKGLAVESIGTDIGCQTCIGSFGDFPRTMGNCFDLISPEGQGIRILNFKLENFEELIRQGVLSLPVRILIVDGRHGVISDPRVPPDWYGDYCSGCTRGVNLQKIQPPQSSPADTAP